MSIPVDVDARIRYVRVVISRFAPIVMSGISEEWTVEVSGRQEWLQFRRLVEQVTATTSSVGSEEVQKIRDLLDGLLYLWDEEPMGNIYYPYKAAELIELHCRMAIGDLCDDAPVSLSEWIERFAGHVDWQLAKSGVDLGEVSYFRHLENRFQNDGWELVNPASSVFEELMTKSKEASLVYVNALTSVLGGR
jgi:hypothetical protein